MTNSDAGKNSAEDSAPAPQKPDAELNETELEQISGGVALATKPTKKSNKDQNDTWP